MTTPNTKPEYKRTIKPPIAITQNRIQDINIEDGITLLLYGPPGTAKTFWAASAGERALLLTTGNGISTLASPLWQKKSFGSPYIEIVEEDIDAFIESRNPVALTRITDLINAYLDKGLIDTIILDSASDLNRFARIEGIAFNDAMGKSETLAKQGSSWGELIPAVQDFGTEMNMVGSFLDKMSRFAVKHGKNFILTGHERFYYQKEVNKQGKKTDTDQVSKIVPAFTGKSFPQTVDQYFDLVWHTNTHKKSDGGNYYSIDTLGDTIVSGKTRWGGLFPDDIFFNREGKQEIYFPDVVRIIKEWKNEKKIPTYTK